MSIQTLPELFLSAIKERPRPDCFSYRDQNRQYVDISSDEVLQSVRALRQALKSLGVKRGDRIAILSENRYEWALSDLAAVFCGCVTVPVYATLLPDTIKYILNDCQPVLIFVSTNEQAEKVDLVRDKVAGLRDIVSFEHTAVPDVMTFDKLLDIGRNIMREHPPEPHDEYDAVEKDDLVSIIYTSGTTGNPKGVMLSHYNFVANVLGTQTVIDFSIKDRCLSFLPLSHVLERTCGYYVMLYSGVGIAYAERMDTVPVDLQEVKPTLVVSVPRLYEKIYARVLGMAQAGSPLKRKIFFWARSVGIEYARREIESLPIGGWLKFKYALADKLVFSKLRARTGGNLRYFVSGGAPLSAKINEFFYAAGLYVLEGYGLTETSPIVTVNRMEKFRIGSVGTPFPNTEVKIAEDGEILVRGPQVMLGYYNNEAATREVLDDEGWFATGDIGYIDEDGFLFITDRKKDLIVTAGGKNIAPQPIENDLKNNRFISQAVVIGDQRSFLTALIVPDFEVLREWAAANDLAGVSDGELIEHAEVLALFDAHMEKINALLPGFNQVKKCSLLAQEFTLEAGELTPTLKIKRFAINNKYREIIDRMYPAAAYDEG